MDEPGNHHSQQTDTRTENQIIHRQVLNKRNTWTQGRGASYTGVFLGGKVMLGWEGQGGITWGEMPDVGDGEMEAANHIAMGAPMQ